MRIDYRLPAAWLGLIAGAAAGDTTIPNPPNPGAQFQIYSDVETYGPLQNQTGINWAQRLDWRGAPVDHNVITLYSDLGEYPREGPHQVLLDPQWMARHFAAIETHVNLKIPDRNWAGMGVIDYEIWWPQWTRTQSTAQNAWRAYIRANRPELLQFLSANEQEAVFKQTFNDAARDFCTATINECRRLRPNAKWGFFGLPRIGD